MYYDPMIAKLIAWGKDRKTSLDLLYKAMEEYIIRGVIHNIGFGQSIVRHPDFSSGNYSTAFIPKNYKDGFRGDKLDKEEYEQLAISAHYLKNLYNQNSRLTGQTQRPEAKELYVSIKEDKDRDFKIVKKNDTTYEVTELPDGKPATVDIKDIQLDYGSLVQLKLNNQERLLQFIDALDDYTFNFYFKGNTLKTEVYEAFQYQYK